MAISLDEMTALARAMQDAEVVVEEKEDALKEAKEHLRVLKEETIPGAMQELGLKDLTLTTGQKLSVKDEVYASVPAANKVKVYSWLDENDFGGMVKTDVTIEYGKGEEGAALELYEELIEKGLTVEFAQNVHPQTLKAFLKEQLAKGTDIPLELFGARSVMTAKLSK